MRCYIYQSLNKINGKRYIGFTIQALSKRIIQHNSDARCGSKCPIHKAIRKYGEENFEWTILYEAIDREYCLNVMEPYFIREISTKIPNGYNISDGGKGGPKLPAQLNPMYGRSHSEEAKEKLRQTGRKTKGKSYEERYGPKKAAELRKIRSEQRKQLFEVNPPVGERNSNYDRTIYRFSHNNGKIFQGTIYQLREADPNMKKSDTSYLKRGGRSKGWKLAL